MLTFGRTASIILVGASAMLAGCRVDNPTAPAATSREPAVEATKFARRWRHANPLDSTRNAQAVRSGIAQCTRREAQSGSAVIGPKGGILVVGNNILYVPPGALDKPTLIQGDVPPTRTASIHLEPAGLRFKKPAGLRLDASGCSDVSEYPTVLYLDDDGNVLERIDATYSNWWHTVAAPITHFSVYAIGV